ncbi:MAG: hypothetical protein A3F77_17805 [Betaproteobacteria bacterium RIFCSPLOWO2_12_FULL_67_28]|nr:MAG: hypothetical protein A3F77_17805 [Betaproteobacteria bacterium RIFCSPLOWO2_12_FULL_67_28]
MNETPIIEPERHGLWIVAAFIVALIALLTSFVAVYRINVVTLGTQTEVLLLNKKIEQMRSAAPMQPQAAPAAPAPAAPGK